MEKNRHEAACLHCLPVGRRRAPCSLRQREIGSKRWSQERRWSPVRPPFCFFGSWAGRQPHWQSQQSLLKEWTRKINPPVGDDELPQREEPPSEEEEQEAEPTYIVPKDHGRFVFQYSQLLNAADNFAKGNAQEESKIISNWLTTGVESAMMHIGCFLEYMVHG